MGDNPEIVADADVEALEENVVQELPPFRLYCHVSQVLLADAEIWKEEEVILEVLKVIVGAVRLIASRLTVADAVIVPMYTPAYVPENRHEADSGTLFFVPSEL